MKRKPIEALLPDIFLFFANSIGYRADYLELDIDKGNSLRCSGIFNGRISMLRRKPSQSHIQNFPQIKAHFGVSKFQ